MKIPTLKAEQYQGIIIFQQISGGLWVAFLLFWLKSMKVSTTATYL